MERERKGGSEDLGLSSWPMSSSYPVTATNSHIEARKMLRMMARKDTKVVLGTAEAGEKVMLNYFTSVV